MMTLKKSKQQVKYWIFHRNGLSQAEIAEKFNVTKQSVSRGINIIEYRVVTRLLEHAASLGALVEWHSGMWGLLLGIVPQLGNMRVIMFVDGNLSIEVLFDSKSNESLTGFAQKLEVISRDAKLTNFGEIHSFVKNLR